MNVDLGVQVIVGFRGTEQVKWKDLVSDINLIPVDINIEGATSERSFFEKIFQQSDSPFVHGGFYEAWLSVRQRVISIVDSCTGRDSSWEVQITGHSLGGALATLAAFTFASRTIVENRVTMYNFGSPRVGNKRFAEEFAALVPDAWRVHNENDVVAAVPRLMGYCHVPNGVRILDGRKIVMLDRQGVDVLGEGQSVSEAVVKLAEVLGGEESKRVEAMESILKHEMQLLENLKGGEALAHHLEDQYLEALCTVISESSPPQKVVRTLKRVQTSIRKYRDLLAAKK